MSFTLIRRLLHPDSSGQAQRLLTGSLVICTNPGEGHLKDKLWEQLNHLLYSSHTYNNVKLIRKSH